MVINPSRSIHTVQSKLNMQYQTLKKVKEKYLFEKTSICRQEKKKEKGGETTRQKWYPSPILTAECNCYVAYSIWLLWLVLDMMLICPPKPLLDSTGPMLCCLAYSSGGRCWVELGLYSTIKSGIIETLCSEANPLRVTPPPPLP